MKSMIFLLLLSLPWAARSQEDSFSLYEYVPRITHQDGKNCFSYAAAYVAISTQKAFVDKRVAPDSAHSFSFGYVDAGIEQLGRRYIRDHIAELYPGYNGMLGDLDYAFFILFKYGTVSYGEFPYITESDISHHKDAFDRNRTDVWKIAAPKEWIADGKKPNTWIADFKNEISTGRPVICAVRPPEAHCFWGNISSYDPSRDRNEVRHIVCIIGYNEAKKQFQVKNNYEEQCTYWYSYQDIGKIIEWAYTYPSVYPARR